MRFKNLFLFLLLAPLLYLGLQQLIELKTRGFCLQRIYAKGLAFQPGWETAPLPSEEKEKIHALLKQPYRFLGAGSECFVFLSEDGQTVLKFFKLNLFRSVYFRRGLFELDFSAYAQTLFPAPSLLPKRVRGMREFRIQRTFDSLMIAYGQLKEQTGLLYLHINPTQEFSCPLTIYDSCNIAHLVNLNQTPFLLQKRATPLLAHFKTLLEKSDFASAKESIDSLITLFLERCQKGISDRDMLGRNFGFIHNRAIEIDGGSFSSMPQMKERWLYNQEILFATFDLKLFLKERAPSLAHYLEEQINQRCGLERKK